MFHSRTVIRVAAMAVLAAGPTVAAVVAPSVPRQQPDVPQASAVLMAPRGDAPRAPGPVRMAPAPAVAQKAPNRPAAEAVVSPAAVSPVVRSLPDVADRNDHSDSPRWILHRVRDGDSLPQLAAKYLGSQERAEEILLWNCDRIDDPAMLPLGVELLIPASGF